jgi:hypothetical protein
MTKQQQMSGRGATGRAVLRGMCAAKNVIVRHTNPALPHGTSEEYRTSFNTSAPLQFAPPPHHHTAAPVHLVREMSPDGPDGDGARART